MSKVNATAAINPVKRELLNNALITIADNAMVMIVRTARSSNVKNSLDFSAAVLDGDGQLVAQGLAVPVHLGAMMPAIKVLSRGNPGRYRRRRYADLQRPLLRLQPFE
jgi:N-methylhydantoinase B/oxoprolinase/acetone carboxylase alpha subunit